MFRIAIVIVIYWTANKGVIVALLRRTISIVRHVKLAVLFAVVISEFRFINCQSWILFT